MPRLLRAQLHHCGKTFFRHPYLFYCSLDSPSSYGDIESKSLASLLMSNSSKRQSCLYFSLPLSTGSLMACRRFELRRTSISITSECGCSSMSIVRRGKKGIYSLVESVDGKQVWKSLHN